ncbi:M23 family metallopeptidase [Vineibacter terrae]|nr:M23 family metallopeptidase [Vineibacter terrae]
MTAAGALSVAWAAPNTQVIRPPQQATATTSKSKPTAVKPAATTGAKRVAVPSKTATRPAPAPAAPAAATAEEAKPFAIDPARPLEEQLVAVGVTPNDARAAARSVTAALKDTPLSAGSTGRAAMAADGAPQRLQSLQIYGAGGLVAEVERNGDGTFAAKGVTATANASAPAVSRGGNQGSDPSSAESGQDDPKVWSAGLGQPQRTARSLRDIAQSTVGLRRVSANGDANVALANAGVDASTARSAALALAAVAPASLDRRSASIELVNGKTGDGQPRLLTATIYDRNTRAQVWWFSPRSQPEGFFDENGNRVGDSSMALPIEGSHISSPFGTRRLGRWAAFHNGLDVAGRYGTPIIAAADGVVDYAGWYYNYGKTVRIVHSDSLATSYSHMSNFAAGVTPGTRVRKGQLIGYVGSTGRSTGPHLHFCVLVDGQFVNPAPYVANGGGRLNGQDLVSFRDWQRTTAGMARGGSGRRTSSEADGYNRL